MGKPLAYMNWSGGKDSSLCLFKAFQEQEYEIKYLLTSINKVHNRISMHGVRRELLQLQALSIGIPLKTIELSEFPEMDEYEKSLEHQIKEMRQEGIFHCFFGDIFLEDLREYRENKLKPMKIKASFPLWKISTTELMDEFIAQGFKAIVVCVNEKYLDKSFCGRIIDKSFVADLPANVDVCGENGEYHSFVFDGPIFKNPIIFNKGEVVYKQYPRPQNNEADTDCPDYGFYFFDLEPV